MTHHLTWTRALTVALALLLALSGNAFSALRVGTDNAETLTGTNSADHITGKGGDDTLKGLAGNDVYHFQGCWGNDTLVERPRHKTTVRRNGKKRTKLIPGGRDTLSFSQHPNPVFVRLIPELSKSDNRVFSSCENGASVMITLDTSPVENAVGGNGADAIDTGGAANVLQPGGGDNDQLRDFGGYSFTDAAFPVSTDMYRGFATNTGLDIIWDFGGAGDVVDLRPFASTDVYIDSFNSDQDAEEESLLIVTGRDGTMDIGIIIVGHFGEHGNYTSAYNQHGRIETLLFGDGTFSGAGSTASVAAALRDVRGKNPKLTKAAERMAREARAELERSPLPDL